MSRGFRNAVGCSVLGFLGLFALGVALTPRSDVPDEASAPPARAHRSASAPHASPRATVDCDQVVSVEQALETNGVFVRVDPTYNDVYVDPSIWAPSDVNTKERWADFALTYCGCRCAHRNLVNILDRTTGKTLATNDDAFGFRLK